MRISRRALTAAGAVAMAIAAAAAAVVAGAQTTPSGSFDVIRKVSVGKNPGPVTYGYGAGWVINRGDPSVTRIDAVTGATITTAVGAGPISITAGYNSIWVLTGEGKAKASIYRLNATSGAVQKTFTVALPINWSADIAPSSGYIWASSDGQPKLVRIDPSKNAAAIKKVPTHAGFTTGNSKLWTTVFVGSNPKLQSWNPKTLEVERSIGIAKAYDGAGTVFLSYGSSHVYVSETEPNDGGSTAAVSLSQGTIVGTYGSNIELQCTDTGNNALWLGIDYDELGGTPAQIVALNEDNLSVLKSQQPFPSGSTNGSVGCIGTGGGYVWVPDGQTSGSVYQLVSSTS
jgi:Repeat of unknown function (DUF6923)